MCFVGKLDEVKRAAVNVWGLNCGVGDVTMITIPTIIIVTIIIM